MDKARIWKLAIGDILFKVNCDVLSSFGSVESPRFVFEQLLGGTWGIDDRESLIETLEELFRHGDSAIYTECETSERTEFEDRFFREFNSQLTAPKLRAWDLGRLATLARWGQHTNLISQADYWELVSPAAEELQKTYSSWDQFAEHYLIGRYFWSQDKHNSEHEHAVNFLTQNVNSPWKMLDWHTDLTHSTEENWNTGNPYQFVQPLQQSRASKAIDHYYRLLLRYDPLDSNLYNAYGLFLEDEIGDTEKAAHYFIKAIEHSHGHNHPFKNLVQLFRRTGKPKRQVQHLFDMWIQRNGDSAMPYFYYADWLTDTQSDDFALIESCYKKALSLEPDNSSIYNDYGFYLHTTMGDYAAARNMYTRALELDPGDQTVQENLATLEQSAQTIRNMANEKQFGRFFRGDLQ